MYQGDFLAERQPKYDNASQLLHIENDQFNFKNPAN